MNEEIIWRPVVNFEGLYEVSNSGFVRSVARVTVDVLGRPKSLKQRTIKLQMSYFGYWQLSLHKDLKLYPTRAHRLVAAAFLPNPNNFKEINHKDGNKLNNHVDNLEWCSRSHNIKHAFANNLVTNSGFNNANCKVNRDVILKIRELASTKKYKHKEIAAIIGLSRSAISEIVSLRRFKDVA